MTDMGWEVGHRWPHPTFLLMTCVSNSSGWAFGWNWGGISGHCATRPDFSHGQSERVTNKSRAHRWISGLHFTALPLFSNVWLRKVTSSHQSLSVTARWWQFNWRSTQPTKSTAQNEDAAHDLQQSELCHQIENKNCLSLHQQPN